MLHTSIKQQKQDVRNRMQSLRKSIPGSERHQFSQVLSQNLFSWVQKHIESKAAIAVYLAAKDEVNIDPFISKALQKNWCLYAPLYCNNTWHLSRLNKVPSEKNRLPKLANSFTYSIRQTEHKTTLCKPQSIKLWIVPGLAFSIKGERLGYGKGIYDRWLCQSKGKKVGIGFSCQVLDKLATEPWDQTLDAIFTPHKIINIT